ncbi:MAG: glycosyltransferase family 2 protein [Elusimicrobia bacterium]|nr:glycosyltransferase family 2 protein [Elusimicrobiota bacterium]
MVWAGRFMLALGAMRRGKFLKDVSCPDNADYPKVSIIVPVRDEADGLAEAFSSKLSSDYPDFEIIAINDRSSDGTGKIIDELSQKDKRVKAVHIKNLPQGWLGKLNAMNAGCSFAGGEWLLFSDADVNISPDALKKAVCYARQNNLDHLSVMPQMWSSCFAIDVLFLSMLELTTRWASWNSENSHKNSAVGIGAFNMVRRRVFEKTPGFEYLKLEVIDDMGLALMMKQSGAKGASLHGKNCVGLYFYKSLKELAGGCDKGLPAGANYNYWFLFALPAVHLILDVAPYALLAVGGWARIFAIFTCALQLAFSLILSKWHGRPILPAFFYPLGILFSTYFPVRAAVIAMRNGGIKWRDTFYSIKELRQNKRFFIKNFY